MAATTPLQDSSKRKNFLPKESSSLSRSVSASDLLRGHSALQSSHSEQLKRLNSPPTNDSLDEFSTELNRLKHYHLDVPDDDEETIKLLRDKNSPYYATDTKRHSKQKKFLPYKTESISDQYKYLSHIVAHLYIAIKSLDLKGNLSISVADLEKAKRSLLNESMHINEGFQVQDDECFETLGKSDSEGEDEDDEDEDGEYEEDGDDEYMFTSTPATKVETKSASIINMKYWTMELKNLLDMRLKIPVYLTKALVSAYYAVILSRGQGVDIMFYNSVIASLTQEKQLLVDSGLKLDWRPIFDELSAGLGYPNASGLLVNEPRRKRLVKFAMTVNWFFEEDCIPPIMEKIMARHTNQTVSQSFINMAVMLPIILKKPIVNPDGQLSYQKTDIRYYLPLLFSQWTTQRSNKEIGCIVTVIANIVNTVPYELTKDPEIAVMGKFGIFTEDQFKLFINQLVITSKLGKVDDKNVNYVKLITECLVYSLTSKNALLKGGIMDLLKTYTEAVHTLVHPSNSGGWSGMLAQIIKKLISIYYVRVLEEKVDRGLISESVDDHSSLPETFKLSNEVTNNFIDTVLPLIHLGLQAKSSSIRKKYYRSLELLCFINPVRTLDSVILDIYQSLESVNSTHRINVVLHELAYLSRFMAVQPVYRVHIPRLLSMLVPGIDLNDPEKTILTIRFVKAVAAVVPFSDLNDNDDGDGGMLALSFTSDHLSFLEAKFYRSSPNKSVNIYGDELPETFEYSAEMELDALKSASSSFSEFIKQFCERCFKCLEDSPNAESDSGIETKASALIAEVFDSLNESMSDDLFQVVADTFYEYITNNVKHLVAIVFSNIAEMIVRRDPKKQFSRLFDYLLPQILSEIEHGAGSSRTQIVLDKDARLIWYSKLLSGAALGAGEELIPYLPELKNFILNQAPKLRGEAAFSTSILANSILSSLSCTRLMERRLISKSWLKKNGGKVTEACWGGFQFDDYRFDEANLNFEWYVPSSSIVEKSVEFFEDVTSYSLNKVQEFISTFDPNEKTSLDVSDQIGYHITIIDGSLLGICTLFDPKFNSTTLTSNNLLRNSLPPASALMSTSASMTSLASYPTEQLQEIAIESSLKALQSELSSETKVDQTSDIEEQSGDANEDIVMKEATFEDEVIDGTDSTNLESLKTESTPTSELASGLVTPSFNDGTHSINASLTNRPSSLDSFGYYFDRSPSQNYSDPVYMKLHQARELIGTTFHELAGCLLQQDGSVDLMSHLLGCISGWLKNVGYFSSNNPILVDNLHMLEILDLQYLNKPHTRTIIGANLAVYHCSRMAMSRSTRLPNEVDKLLIKDLVSLSASSYNSTSFHAASVLSSTLRKILNCTGYFFNIFKYWENALVNKDHDKLGNILRLFNWKRFKGLAEKSHYLPKYEDLLSQSIAFDDLNVSTRALKLYGLIKKHIKVPSTVCIVDMSLVEAIRPPDDNVDLQISVVKLAKDRKRKQLFANMEKTEALVLRRADSNMHWKFLMKILELLASLQSHHETKLNADIVTLLANSINGVHPAITKKCVAWLANIVDLTETKAMFQYDLNAILSVSPNEVDISSLSSIIGKDNSAGFFEEMKNFTNPKFFIDNKLWVPTLCWGNEMRVINTYVPETLGLDENDTKGINELGKIVTKKWLLEYITLHIDESESNTVFLPGLVYFLSSIASLSMYGHTPNFKYEKYFEITDEIYIKDKKQTHIAVSEIFCALLLAGKKNPAKMESTDSFIAEKLFKIFTTEVTQATAQIWKVFCWWLPAHLDGRRYPKLTRVICDFDIETSESGSPFMISSRINFLKLYMSSTMNRFHDFDNVIDKLFESLSHPYKIVAEMSASTLFDCLLFTSTTSFDNFDQLMVANQKSDDGMGVTPHSLNNKIHENLIKYLERMKAIKPDLTDMSAQKLAASEYMYAVRGLHEFLFQTLRTAHGSLLVPYLKEYIIPHLFELDEMKDTCQLLGLSPTIQFYLISSIRYSKQETPIIIESMCNDHGLKSPTLSQYSQLLTFISAYYNVRFLTISQEERSRLVKKCTSFLYNQHLTIREQAASQFSAIIHSYISSSTDKLINRYIKEFTKILNKHTKVKGTKLTPEQIHQVHGATLGMGALVDAFPYTSPPPYWLSDILSLLARKCSNYDGIVGRTAKDTLSKFKKTRQDTWHIDSKFFSEEQLEDLEGVLWKSYFI
ncbi:hypothetical protein CANARDRAFT_28348 [[Candida] arabinofermentans NRRL YB-2248]|uniref:Proteasome activator BLM10 n=1 Tax=[Candida] arabinofermentans NRRL YB-2248 TaxID=983967 RepID=A0A1E4T1H7_9ASCO|nr:hypothetical protein CANARDRAFT_28348 [[Candida] arabinofermentans NRRL YB-2248]